MIRRDVFALLWLAGLVAAWAATAAIVAQCAPAFWAQHSDAAGFGFLLYFVFALLLLAHDRATYNQLQRVRGQRDRAHDRLFVERASIEHADDADAYRPVWTTGAPREAVDDEFDDIMRHAFTEGGER